MLNYFEIHAMHKGTSYGPTSSKYDHVDLYLTPVTLNFNLPKNVSSSTSQGQQLCQIVLKSMHYCTSYDHLDGYMHAHTHIQRTKRTKVVTTVSRLPANRLGKKDRS